MEASTAEVLDATCSSCGEPAVVLASTGGRAGLLKAGASRQQACGSRSLALSGLLLFGGIETENMKLQAPPTLKGVICGSERPAVVACATPVK